MRAAAGFAGALALAVAAAPSASAQAWASPAGQGWVTLAVQGIDNTGHVLRDGSTAAVGKSRNAAVYLEAAYAVTDRLSLSAGVPFVFAKYLGPRLDPEPPMVQPVDACYCWQDGLQDFGLTARFNVLNGSTALTPSVSFGVPSHGYEHVGEAVVGRGLRELRLAVDVGQRLDFLSPRLAVEGRYSYAFVERVLDVSTNRSNASFAVAFQALDRLAVRAVVSRQVTHGGLQPGLEPAPQPDGYPWGDITTAELFREHDRLLRDDSWHVGAALSYGFARADLFATYVEFVSGRNTHAGRAFTLGVSIPFGR
jgi:hypothetical protein